MPITVGERRRRNGWHGREQTNVNALVVDDSRAMRMILSRIMRELGFETYEAENGQEALELLQQVGSIDLALVDWNMPVMNGLEFILAVRSNPRYADTRILMVTSETDLGNVTEALAAGADEYAMKPFDRSMIMDKLELVGLGA